MGTTRSLVMLRHILLNIISEADEKVGFISAKIDTKLVKDIRKKMPATTNYTF